MKKIKFNIDTEIKANCLKILGKKARTYFKYKISTKGYSYPVVTKIITEKCTSLKL